MKKGYQVTKKDLIGYKKIKRNTRSSVIIQLIIPKGTKIYVGNYKAYSMHQKIRAEQAYAVCYTPRYIFPRCGGSFSGSIKSIGFHNRTHSMTYQMGEMNYPDKFDTKRHSRSCDTECSNGIHFFLTLDEAERYC